MSRYCRNDIIFKQVRYYEISVAAIENEPAPSDQSEFSTAETKDNDTLPESNPAVYQDKCLSGC